MLLSLLYPFSFARDGYLTDEEAERVKSYELLNSLMKWEELNFICEGKRIARDFFGTSVLIHELNGTFNYSDASMNSREFYSPKLTLEGTTLNLPREYNKLAIVVCFSLLILDKRL